MFFLALIALAPPKFPMTIESIMRGPALVGQAPRGLRWSADGSEVRFQWAKADGTPDPRYKAYVVKKDGTGLKLGAGDGPAYEGPARPKLEQPEVIVYESGGDLYLNDTVKKTTKRLTETPDTESNPKLVAGGKSVVYTLGNNLYRINVDDLTKTQLTDLKDEGDKNSPGASKGTLIKTPAGMKSGTFALSPDGTHASIDFTQFAAGAKRADVPNYITSSNYPEMISTFPRVGAPQSHNKTLVIDLENGSTFEISPTKSSRVTGLRWSPDGISAVAIARSEDHKDEWIYGFDEKTDKVSVLWNEHCDAWVGGPARGTFGWIPDSNRFYFTSEKNGYANLYSMIPAGGAPQPIVTGDFEVSDVRLDAERKRFTFVSSEGSPFKRHLDTVPLSGGPHKKLADLTADEDSSYAIAPDGVTVAVVRSKPNRPAELFVNNVQVTSSPTEEWLAGPWIEPTVVMIPSTDGVKVPTRFYKPKDWKKGGPGVIFVHGAGYLQNVYDGWSHYFREYMFHHVLMEHGYAVLDMDYRGSAGYGRDWRTAIYRHMGGKDLDDEIAGADWLVQQQGVAKDRLGIYGGSYGGFITLMAMFTKPDVFAAGAALRPVADWSTYNHQYTSEILNNPQDDKEAYRQSSPINFAAGLKGALLICHGMVDTNVPFQDSVRVTEKLIELGKTNWELAPYPVEDHAFTRPASWTDEYRRIFDLFERTIGSKRKK